MTFNREKQIRIEIFGDLLGVPQILRRLPAECVAGIVRAGIRPQYLAELNQLHKIPHYQSIWQITAQKYSAVERGADAV